MLVPLAWSCCPRRPNLRPHLFRAPPTRDWFAFCQLHWLVVDTPTGRRKKNCDRIVSFLLIFRFLSSFSFEFCRPVQKALVINKKRRLTVKTHIEAIKRRLCAAPTRRRDRSPNHPIGTTVLGTMIAVDSASRQRVAVSSGMPYEDDQMMMIRSQQQQQVLVESSVSTDDAEREEDKYNKRSRRKKLRRAKKKKQAARTTEIVGLLLMFTTILLFWHFNVKMRHDRHRHAQALYERAESIIKNLNKGKQHPRDHDPWAKFHQQEHGQPHHHHQGGPPGGMRHPSQLGDEPSTAEIEEMFAQHRLEPSSLETIVPGILNAWIRKWDMDVKNNVQGGIRWIRPYLLPGMDDLPNQNKRDGERHGGGLGIFHADRTNYRLKWQDEWDELVEKYGGEENIPGPTVDYTDPDKYEYPPLMEEPPAEGGYPRLTSLGDMMEAWDQDADNEGTIEEVLLHFDYSNPREMAMAEKFREAMLPFKLVNVPELLRAKDLWTDEYVAHGFGVDGYRPNLAQGTCQESPNHYFAFFQPKNWSKERMGIPPTRNNDMEFDEWARHARYADATSLASDAPHFYWQSGVNKEERHQSKKLYSFISQDLPSWSATEPNFIMFNPEEQKGIQCRFGERGVVAATHYDSGR